MRPERTILPLVIAALLCGAPAIAADDAAPIELEADSVIYNEKTGVSVYRGKVRIVQGGITLQGDVVEVFSKNGDVEKLISTASPSRFVQREQNRVTRAEAKRIEYRAADGMVDLHGDARIFDADKSLSGDHISYDIRNRVVKAGKGGKRVKLTLQPSRETGGQAP